MPASVVIQLHAQNAGSLLNSNGLILEAVWFAGDGLHEDNAQMQPFTVSSLMGMRAHSNGVCHFREGQHAWFRVTTLNDDLTSRLDDWCAGFGQNPIIKLGQSIWQVQQIATRTDEHDWAGRITYDSFLEVFLSRFSPVKWTLEFATPTMFNGAFFVYPFPQPESLVRSWLQRWQQFAPQRLSEELPELARKHLAILGYTLSTENVRLHGKTYPGAVGKMTLGDRGLAPEMRQTLDMLMHYAFFCGSGYKTTQGLGQTRLLIE